MTDYVTDYDPPELEPLIDRYSGESHSLLRIVAALLFFLHGTSKLLGFPPFEGGPPPIYSLIWVAGIFELIGGLLLIIGLASRPVAFLLSGEMAVAYWMAHAPQSLFPSNNGGEAAILFCFIFLFIAATGPGPWSVDAALKRRRLLGSEGELVGSEA
jgi:putative oxidoreductase